MLVLIMMMMMTMMMILSVLHQFVIVTMIRDLVQALPEIQQDAWREHFQERVEEVGVIIIIIIIIIITTSSIVIITSHHFHHIVHTRSGPG